MNKDWYENDDRYSSCFDLKWTCKAKDIYTTHLSEF